MNTFECISNDKGKCKLEGGIKSICSHFTIVNTSILHDVNPI